MRSPEAAGAISHEWVEFVVQHHEAKSDPNVDVKLISFSVAMACKPGENFNSELVRVDASAGVRRTDSSESSSTTIVNKDYSFIVKFLSVDPFNREMMKVTGNHSRELVFYSDLMSALNSHWESNASTLEVDQKLHGPEYIYGVCSPSEYVLVLENCKVAGFEMNDKRSALDFEHILLAVNQMARLHALSHSFNLTTNICSKYPGFQYQPKLGSLMGLFGSIMLELTVKYIRTLPEHKDILVKLEKGRRTIERKFQMISDPSQHKMLTLVHGDFWNCNLLFSYHPSSEDGKQKVKTVKLIDWQLSQWSNPMFDLHYLLNTSTTSGMRERHLDDILHHYHSTFLNISDNVKTPVSDWSYDQFNAEYRRTALVGFFMGLMTLQGSLSKNAEKISAGANGPPSAQAEKSVANKLKAAAAKALTPLALKPSFQFIIKFAMKKMVEPITQELIEGKNEALNERVLELILEADRKGVLDDLTTV